MNRKHWILILAGVLLFVGVAELMAGPPQRHIIGTSSAMVIPPRGRISAPDYATNTSYQVSDIVKSANAFWFCVTTNGLSVSNSLSGVSRASDGSNTWQRIESGKRNGFAIVNDGKNACYLSFGSPAVTASGIRLNANGGSASDFSGLYQGAIYAISAGANNVTAQEW